MNTPERFDPHRRMPHARVWRLLLGAVALALPLASGIAACALDPRGAKGGDTVALATIFPTAGAGGAIGRSMTQAVDLAVSQHASLGRGYTLKVIHLDESSGSLVADATHAAGEPDIMGVVGPFSSEAAIETAPVLAAAGVVTISPTAMLPGLTQSDQAAAEGLAFSKLHPPGKPASFFRMTADDNAAGAAAARLALAPRSAHGLSARSVFLVDDGSLSGAAQISAFSRAFQAAGGVVAGRRDIAPDDAIGVQSAVSAIISSNPDAVFFAGDLALGATLRGVLTLTGAPMLVMLTAGPIADNPAWSDTVGGGALSAYTTGLLPAQSLSQLPGGASFIRAFKAAYPGTVVTPLSAVAYDAAMDEISAITSLISAGKPVTRAAVLATVASAKYAGVTGAVTFDQRGDPKTPHPFTVYTCDTKGAWSYQTTIAG